MHILSPYLFCGHQLVSLFFNLDLHTVGHQQVKRLSKGGVLPRKTRAGKS